MPVAEVEITSDLVRALIDDQQPGLSGLPIALIANGWDNVMFRLGPRHTVRLPRRKLAVPLMEHEQRWLPSLAASLPLPIPAPVHAGWPAAGFPWPWSICPWMPGAIAEGAAIDAYTVAEQVGGFLAALHRPAPSDAPVNEFRGIPLSQRDGVLRDRVSGLSAIVDTAATLALWGALVATPVWSGPPMWLHGDLHPANILVESGRVSGVIDFGDITAGDPATDLAVAWMLLPAEARPAFRAAAGEVDDDTWNRARGWALALSIAYMAGSANNPLIFEIGKRTWESATANQQ